MIILAFFEKHLIWSVQTANGRTDYFYYDAITWIVAALVLAWLVWFFVTRYLRNKSLRRKPRSRRDKSLKNIIKIKNELTSLWLKKGISQKIHAVGVGKLANGAYCIQIFISDSNAQMFESNANQNIPNQYKNVPLILVGMPQARLLTTENLSANFSTEEYRKLIRERHDVIIGGISGANANLDGNSGTIGYFCRRKSLFPRRTEVCLLSNSHVFADLRRQTVEEHDFILQPSPGEPAMSRPVAELIHLSPLKFENDVTDANFVDAAIAKLLRGQPHKPLLPFIGEIKRYVEKSEVEPGENVRKFGRTTGYTCGKIFSIALDIRIKYDRTGKQAFFRDQFLIEPDKKTCEKFVEKGDSGSLLVDGENNAVGLIFAGANGNVNFENEEQKPAICINNYGLANSISEVMSRMKIELLLESSSD